MAQKIVVTRVDDVDGEPADETVRFSLDGVDYEIDLSADNASDLRNGLAGYVSAGRRVGGRNIAVRAGRRERSHRSRM